LAERRQRPVGVGAANGKTKRPGIDRRAAPGANDNLKFRVLPGRQPSADT
jgi:hypothetical protein